MFAWALKKVFGTSHEREIKRLRPRIEAINALEPRISALSDAELKAKTPFVKMPAAEQDAYLHSLEAGSKNLGGVPSNVFFATLWECTVEGFFSDPVYGGNRDMVAWRMIGFPGAYASYYDLVDQHGIKFDLPPTSLPEDVHGHVHANPDMPARLP